MSINFVDITDYLGQPVKTQSGHSYFQCPICKDSKRDNLVYTHSKGLFKCFADDSHSRQILSDMQRSKKDKDFKRESMPVTHKKEIIKSDIDLDYIIQCNNELVNCSKSIAFLKKHRGLHGETLQLGFGIDKKNKRWVFPAFDFDNNLTGAEYRPADLSKNGIHKAKGTKSELCLVNTLNTKGKNLIITEGFIDAYTYWQYLFENNQHYYYEAATPSNGVATIPNLLNRIKPFNYNKIIFHLDNDEAGHKAINQIKENAKFNFEVKLNDCNCCKDFGEYYLKHIGDNK